MVKVLSVGVVVLVVLVAIVLVMAATKPATFSVERSAVIAAPPEDRPLDHRLP